MGTGTFVATSPTLPNGWPQELTTRGATEMSKMNFKKHTFLSALHERLKTVKKGVEKLSTINPTLPPVEEPIFDPSARVIKI